MHRDWFMDGANVFVEIYEDRIEVVSPGGLPKGMTLHDLGHRSVRRNALIADLLHRIDFIEKAGTGIKRIREDARKHGCPIPDFENNGFFTTIFHPNPEVRMQVGAQSGAQSRAQSSIQLVRVLAALSEQDLSSFELFESLALQSKTGSLKRTLRWMRENELIEYTLPEKPASRLQRYRITGKGRETLKEHQGK